MVSLSEAGRAQIESTIAEIEQRTAAELVVVAIDSSDAYAATKLAYALGAALMAGGFLHMYAPYGWEIWAPWLQLAAAIVAFGITSLPMMLRLAVPKVQLQRAVEQRARLAFFDHSLFATRDRTGVLIMLSQLERRVVILGDSGIHAKVKVEGWRKHVDHIVQAIRAGRVEQGVCETLRAIGEILSAEFPVRADDVNELPNTVRQDRR
ncbi:MAG: hypothetical protein RL701_72 [Pseudomonadota bacterium]